jgi:hypothetical protein
MRKEYTISFNRARKSEKVIRDFLLKKSNIIRLTKIYWSEFKFPQIKKFGGENDPNFAKVLNNLKPAFIKKITNNKRFNDMDQGKKLFDHYFYKITPEVKELINKETLFWNSAKSEHFYGFEDLTFYQDDTMIGSVITHEPIVILYLNDVEV